MTCWRLRDYLIVAGLAASALPVIAPVSVARAGRVEIDAQTGLLSVALAGCLGFLALDGIPGRWF
jgi:hypothetical protein